ncbi:MAG: hypothetical protein OK404_01700 [Thaumarchaeota archaeon]|nr:hypothetical protein [Nitrososphaerota archaeon]
MSIRGSTIVGLIVSILIVGAVASIGYYQVVVAPLYITSSTTSAPQVNCATSHTCVNVTIVSGAQTPYTGYNPGSTTLFGYGPTTITLVIGVNNTIVWRNNDTAFHTATSTTSAPAPFNSRCLDGIGAPCPPGQGPGLSTFEFTFTVAGRYSYDCVYHAWMKGTVIVKSA